MALQTKVYSQTSNTFTLELTLVENSTSTAGNSSSVSYTLKLKSTTKDFYQFGVGATVVLDGKTVATRDRSSAPQIGISTNSSVTLLSGTTNIAHNTDGSKSMSVKFTLDMASASYTPGPMSKTGTMTLTDIPRGATITSAPNFTDEDSPTVKISNPAGGTLQVGIYKTDGATALAAYRTMTGTSYTFQFTNAEREALQKVSTTSNTATVRFYLKSVVGGQTFTVYSAKTLTIKNPAPILAPTVEDVNQATLALTGDANVMVRYASNAQVTTGAQAVKFATIKSQSVKCGNKSLSGDGTISGPESGDFVISVTDSRGNTTTQTVQKTLVPYINLTCFIGKGVPNALGEYDLSVSGDCFNGSFGAAENQITAEFRFAPKGPALGDDWLPMTVSPSGNGYTAAANIEGLDYRTTYTFQARVTDLLGTVESATKIVVSRPLAEWGENYWKFNVPVSAAEIDDAGEEHVYSLLGAAKALSEAYELESSITPALNYSSATIEAYLVGGNVRFLLNATRSTATGAGNITNEEVAAVTVKHDGKILSLWGNSFCNGPTGPLAGMTTAGIVNGATETTFTIRLNSTESALSGIQTFFTLPARLDLSKF